MRETVHEIVRLLAARYGLPHSHPEGDLVSVLVQTVLSQNTSDVNSGRSFRSLRTAYPDWDGLAAADPGRIAEAIRAGGLATVKGRRIKDLLLAIKRQRGNLDLAFLSEMPIGAALDWLKGLPGVGDKTAACVLLFALGRPALPVDTHIHRVSRRLGLIGGTVSAERAHAVLGQLVPESLVYQFHVLMIEHGRRTCRARNPACPSCVLNHLCPSFRTSR